MYSSDYARRLCIGAVFFLVSGCETTKPPPDFRVELSKHPQSGAIIDDVPNGSPETLMKGSGALASVLSYWHHPTDAQAIDAAIARDFRDREYEEALMAVADRQGQWSFATYGNIAMMQTRIAHGVPVIVQLQNDAGDSRSRRFAVVIGYDEAEKRFFCYEGGPNPRSYGYTDFMERWLPVRLWMLLVAPPAQLTWDLSPAEHATLARFYESRNQLDDALTELKSAMAVDPLNSRICVNTANLYRKMGDLDRAEGLYRRAIDLNPAEGQAFNNLAYLKAEHDGDLVEAESLAKKALLLEPTNPVALDTLGYIQFKQGRFFEAVTHLDQAYARSRQLPAVRQREIALHLARACVANGQGPRATQILREILASDSSFVVPDDLRDLAPQVK